MVVGQTLVIITKNDIKKFKQIEVNGYAYPNIDQIVLTKSLPYLTYLSIFSYSVTSDGNLKTIDDIDLINKAKNYRVVPIMVITNTDEENKFSSNLAHTILNNKDIQNKLIFNILQILLQKGYGGLNIDFEYVYPQDKEAYINFINNVNIAIKVYNYIIMVSVAPKTSDEQEGLLYEAHDYNTIGKLVDRIIIMTYEWGYQGGPARAVAPIGLVQEVLDYAVEEIPSNKILLGIPNYGYDWMIPYTEGSTAKSIGNYEAVDIARDYHQSINYNYVDQTPYFNYYDSSKKKHEVWFEDARSIQAKLELVIKYNLAGISYWTINRFFSQNYLILDSLFASKKY